MIIKHTKISDPAKSWWPGSPEVEPYMIKVSKTLDKHNLPPERRTDIYNRCYEAVYAAIKDRNLLIEQALKMKAKS